MSCLLEDSLWDELDALEEGASLLSEEVSLEEGPALLSDDFSLEEGAEEEGAEDDSLEAGSEEGVSEDASLEAGSDDFSLDEGVSEEAGCSEEGMEDSVSDVPFELEDCSSLVCSAELEEGLEEEVSRCDEAASLEEAALEEEGGVVPHAKSVKAARQHRSRFFFIASHYPKFAKMGKKKRAGLTRVNDEIAYLSL